ncbi:hypothetical protein GCM10022232_38890 [Streptomyces plumbiresistens]|uniref:YCII-related domain-containing protein n=1 Tax=Streptomyces plumbiresistens TaxID=511811 RepID=A0ABP7RIA5_9ACTN
MIARGPTFAGDGETPTGSVHIVDLPDPAAARSFLVGRPVATGASCWASARADDGTTWLGTAVLVRA